MVHEEIHKKLEKNCDLKFDTKGKKGQRIHKWRQNGWKKSLGWKAPPNGERKFFGCGGVSSSTFSSFVIFRFAITFLILRFNI